MTRLPTIFVLVLASASPLAAVSPTPGPSPSASPVPAGPLPGQILINEVMANPVGTDTGSEWVELSNLTDAALPIGGMTISRSSGSTIATVPAGTVIVPRGYKKVMATGSIINSGDTLVLKLGSVEHDRITYDSAGAEGQSWNRISLTEGKWSDTPTPEAANAVQEVVDEEELTAVTGASSRAASASSTKKATSSKKPAAGKLPKSGPGIWAYLIPPLGWALWRYARERRRHPTHRIRR